MTETQIEAEVVRILREISHELAEAAITADTAFADLGLDSLTRIDVLAAAETSFGIEIPDERIASLLRVQDVVEYIATVRAG